MQMNYSAQEKEELSCAKPVDSCDETMNTDKDGEREAATDEEDSACPLFMQGLPKDFSTNPGLAALASLLNEEEKDNSTCKDDLPLSVSPPRPSVGGGKLRTSNRSRKSSRHQPYRKKATKESKGSMGEAQLFLSMWKI